MAALLVTLPRSPGWGMCFGWYQVSPQPDAAQLIR